MTRNVRHLRPEHLAGRRWRGLVRESTAAQQEKWSPERQRSDLRRAAEELGLVPAEPLFYERVGSGEVEGAPELARALADARARQYDVLLVLHTSRFARNRREAVNLKAEFAAAGVPIYFVAQRLLSGTREGFLLEGMSEVIDQAENETRRMWVAGGLRERQLAGRWVGNVPFGYRKRMDPQPDGSRIWTGGLDADPDAAAWVARIFGAYVGGTQARAIALRLNMEGVRTASGGPWHQREVRRLLRNPAYIGHLTRYRVSRPEHYYDEQDERDGRATTIGDWPPLVDEPTFAAVQELFARRATTRRAAPVTFPLSGVLRCGGCGWTMTGQAARSGRYYRCTNRIESAGCTAPYARADDLEGEFAAWLARYRLPDDWREAIVELDDPEPPGKRDALEATLTRIRNLYTWGELDEAEYRRRADEIRDELARAVRPAVADLEALAAALMQIGPSWQRVSPERKASVVRAFLKAAIVRDRRITDFVVHAEIRPLLEACVAEGHSLYVEAPGYTVRYSA